MHFELKIIGNNADEIIQGAGLLAAVARMESRRQMPAPDQLQGEQIEAPAETPEPEVNPSGKPKRKPNAAAVKRQIDVEKAATVTTEVPQAETPTVAEPKVEAPAETVEPKVFTYDEVKAKLMERGNDVRQKFQRPDAYKEEVRAIMLGAGVPKKPESGEPGLSLIQPEHHAKLAAICDALTAASTGFSGDEAAWGQKRAAVIAEIAA